MNVYLQVESLTNNNMLNCSNEPDEMYQTELENWLKCTRTIQGRTKWYCIFFHKTLVRAAVQIRVIDRTFMMKLWNAACELTVVEEVSPLFIFGSDIHCSMSDIEEKKNKII